MGNLPKIKNINVRSNETEILDHKKISIDELDVIYENINKINSWLGGNLPTISEIKKYIKTSEKDHLTIVDIGSGGGGMCRKIADFLNKKGLSHNIIGVDINEDSLKIARKRSEKYDTISFDNINVFSSEFKDLKADIIVSTLTFHHLKNDEIIKILDNCLASEKVFIIINDLHRSKLAFHLFRLVAFIFSMHFINVNDGLISILRSFKRSDLIALSQKIKFKHPSIKTSVKWKWAFRWIWTINKT